MQSLQYLFWHKPLARPLRIAFFHIARANKSEWAEPRKQIRAIKKQTKELISDRLDLEREIEKQTKLISDAIAKNAALKADIVELQREYRENLQKLLGSVLYKEFDRAFTAFAEAAKETTNPQESQRLQRQAEWLLMKAERKARFKLPFVPV